jgi:hypothetical protein
MIALSDTWLGRSLCHHLIAETILALVLGALDFEISQSCAPGFGVSGQRFHEFSSSWSLIAETIIVLALKRQPSKSAKIASARWKLQ